MPANLMRVRKEQLDKVTSYTLMIDRTVDHIALSDKWAWERRKLQMDLECIKLEKMILNNFPTLVAAEFWYRTHLSGSLMMARRLFLETSRYQTAE